MKTSRSKKIYHPGYSQTPLLKKLGFERGRINYVDSFAPYFSEVKDAIILGADAPYDFIHIFVKTRAELEKSLTFALKKLSKTGMVWVSWPKKTAKIETDLDGNVVRAYGLASGVVDVKIAAIDAFWSGLKFVYRLRDRK